MKHCARPPIALTMGDPAGCGPQISQKAWALLKDAPEMCFVAIGPEAVFADFGPVRSIDALSEASEVFGTALPVLDTAIACPNIRPGTPNAEAALAIIGSIETATALVLSGEASALVTNPINKALLYRKGFAHPGHTEFLAELTANDGPAPLPVMMLVGGGLRVALASIHVPLMQVGSLLTQDLLIRVGQTTHDALVRDFGIAQPRIGFTGLNPHAGEDGMLGREEVEVIGPAAQALRLGGVNVSDPLSADTIFAQMLADEFDAIIAMTHDQGLIPVKTLDFWGGVNVSLGLPIVRTSPDHGTAYEAAGKGICRADSLIGAIRLASQMAGRRAK